MSVGSSQTEKDTGEKAISGEQATSCAKDAARDDKAASSLREHADAD